MFDDIFEADFFDDVIVEEDVDYEYDDYDDAYEDVDIFDENYFEAMEGGNRDNKVSKKKWEKRQVESDEFKSQVAKLGPYAPQPSRRLYRRFNNPNSFLEGKQAKRKGADDRNYYLAQNAGQSVSARQKRHDVDREDSYVRRYKDAQSRIMMDRANKRDYRIHKNVVHEMNHPTKVSWD